MSWLRRLLQRIRSITFRQIGFGVIALVIFFAVVLGVISIWDYTNSPPFCGTVCHTMPPQYASWNNSSHARVNCVECHIGRIYFGLTFTRKIYDINHVINYTTGHYEYPLHVTNLIPARESCERCHWPEKFSFDKLVQAPRYQDDKNNTLSTVSLAMKTGGGTARQGLGFGIHWHIENAVDFIATDDLMQNIPWVQVTDPQGNQTIYTDIQKPLTADQVAKAEKRRMDCNDCHNRVSHLFASPVQVMDAGLQTKQVDAEIPFIHQKGVELLSRKYDSLAAANQAFDGLVDYYSKEQSDFTRQNGAAIKSAVEYLKRNYQEMVFPDQKVNWQTHPDNVGHKDWPGCFRCHDGKHLTADNKRAIRLECNICHAIPEVATPGGPAPVISLARPDEPDSHKTTTWLAEHRNVFNTTCQACHDTNNAGGKDNSSFCSNNACHGTEWKFVGLNAPKLVGIFKPPVPPVRDPNAPAAQIPHPIGGNPDCQLCHGLQSKVRPYPSDHAGRSNDVCLACHKPAVPATAPTPVAGPPGAATPSTTAGGPPVIPHDTAGRTQCLGCHGSGAAGVPQIPQFHKDAGFKNENCLTCHKMGVVSQPTVAPTVATKPTVVPTSAAPATAVPATVAPAAKPTVAPTTAVPPTPAPQPPVTKLTVVGVPGNAALPGAITVTLKYITDTKVGEASIVRGQSTSGLSNVPINVPVRVMVSAANPKNTGKPTWTLTAPSGSKATFKDPSAMTAEFTPDVVGAYMVSVSLKGDTGTSNTEYAFFNAGTFIGVDAGGCKTCHPTKVAEWAKTGHASIFKDNIDNSRTPTVESHYAEYCAQCHTVGYFLPAGNNGGFADAEAKTSWKVPTWDKINTAGKKTGPSNFDTAPAEIKNMGNVQCENCHGPANEHVKNGADVMAVSFRNDTCNACHAGGDTHIKGLEIVNSKHYSGPSFEEVNGPGEQQCVRCHSGAGFASFTANPKNMAAWNNEEAYIGCPACHDPHSDANYAQLHIVGTPVEVPFTGAKNVGLSGICETCHNTRRNSDDQAKNITDGKSVSYPHYSSAAEMLSNVGGVTYGQTVPNDIHSAFVGIAPVPNPATPGTFLFSKSDDKKGNIPGPCVVCHMWPTTDNKDPNFMQVGEHSFNTVSPDGKDYVASCNQQGCHAASPLKDFNRTAAADYDGSGKVEGVQDEMKGLLNVVWQQLEAKGWKKNNIGGTYADIPATADAKQKSAWFNFRFVYGVMWSETGQGNQGAAAAIHNFKRSCALLQLSLKDLGALPSGAADCTK